MVDGRYQLHPTLIDSDYRRFTAALTGAAEARRVPDDAARRAALQSAADLYRGEALGGDYQWAIPVRERLRRQASDALATLATLLTTLPTPSDPRRAPAATGDGNPYPTGLLHWASTRDLDRKIFGWAVSRPR